MTDKTLAEIIEYVEEMKIKEGFGLGGPTPDQAYNLAIKRVLSYLNSLKKETHDN